MGVLYGVLIGIAVIGIWFISVYNSFKKMVVRCDEASSGIDVALAKRYDLITNLVATVKGYAKHEESVFTQVAQIRSLIKGNRSAAADQLDEAKGKLLAIAESYPELKASANFLDLQRSLSDVEEHLQASRRLYNHMVAALNTKKEQFPSNIVAGMIGESGRDFFQADEIQRSRVEIG
ncbi:MAG: LemA family protein [Erysipelotrichaceae bacterium]|jgi:LemA protein|nr:LemA family protein [Erysipelotrichaceae bacterium]